MPEKIQKNDFVEIEFTGKVKEGNIFDTNIKEEAKKINLEIEAKPLVVCVGQGMVVSGFDKALEGKEEGKSYEIELKPEKAFGNRDSKLVRLIPLKAFLAQKIMPEPGMMLTLDNMLVRISSVSGGRVLTDFNNPLSGKNIIYNFKILRKISSQEEKINTLQDFFFKKRLEYKIEGKKLIFKIRDKGFENFVKLFAKKFKEILDLDLEAEIAEKKQEEKKEEAKDKKPKQVEKKAEVKEEKKEEEWPDLDIGVDVFAEQGKK